LRGRIDDLQLRISDVSEKQNVFLQQLAIRELEGQKQRIDTYEIQARYELAAIYDRAANPPSPPAATPAPSAAPQESPAPPKEQP
jgi:hypothetical protein